LARHYSWGGDDNYGLESNFSFLITEQKTTKHQKHMKKLLNTAGIASIGTVLVLLSASDAIAASESEIYTKEVLLAQSSFKGITVTTPKQKEAVNGLAQGRCSAVTFNKKLFYVFPTETKDKFYVGKQAQFDRYKKALAVQKAREPAGQSLYPTLETAGPNHIEVQQFGGFGPMGTAAMGDW
jgi:hypothetical protein